MKPKNFPKKKLLRQLKAEKKMIKDFEDILIIAREKRTKKHRGK